MGRVKQVAEVGAGGEYLLDHSAIAGTRPSRELS